MPRVSAGTTIADPAGLQQPSQRTVRRSRPP